MSALFETEYGVTENVFSSVPYYFKRELVFEFFLLSCSDQTMKIYIIVDES